jgi:Tol biopolymer transport system component/N-acetylneuraminic acid mutarotase
MKTSKLRMKLPRAAFGVAAGLLMGAALTQLAAADTYAPPFLWHQIANLPEGRRACATAMIEGRVYLAGGIPPGGGSPWAVTTAVVYDPLSNTWSNLPSMSYQRYGAGAGVITAPDGRKELYVVGGYNGGVGGPWVERYIVNSNAWETVASLDMARGEGVVVAVVSNSIYAIGGHPNYCDIKTNNQMYIRASDSWIDRAPAPQPVYYALSATYGGKILLFGGVAAGCTEVLTSMMIYDTQSDSWSPGADMPRARSKGYGATAVVFNDKIYLVGGVASSSTNEQRIIDVYDPSSNTWAVAGLYPFDNILDLPGSAINFASEPGVVYALGSESADLRCYHGQFDYLNLTAVSSSNDFAHVWSPDGKKIAFNRNVHGDGILEICIVEVAWPHAITNVFTGGSLKDWQGDWILFIKWESNVHTNVNGDGELYKMHPDGSGLTRLTFTQSNGTRSNSMDNNPLCGTVMMIQPSFSPDLTQAAFIAHDGNGWYDAYVVAADGSGSQYMLNDGSGHTDTVAWSRDGSHLLYATGADYNQPHTMYLCNRNGSGDVAIATDINSTYGLEYSFTPAGNGILYVDGPDPASRDLWFMGLDGSGKTNLTQTSADEFFGLRDVPDPGFDMAYGHGSRQSIWSPDGSAVYFTRDTAGNKDIWSMNLATGAQTQVTTNAGLDYLAVVSPQGDEIAFISDRSGNWDIWVMEIPSAPFIKTQPATQNVSPGQPATFCAQVTGSQPFQYQWHLNGTNISGATAACYTIPATGPEHAGHYTLVVSNAFGSVTSSVASLALVDLKMLATVYITGTIGSQYRVEYAPSLKEPRTWTSLTNVTLSSSPFLVIDYDSPMAPKRFYRALPLP